MPEAGTRRRKDFGETEGVQLKLEKKKKIEEEKPKEDGELGPFGYLYKRVRSKRQKKIENSDHLAICIKGYDCLVHHGQSGFK